MSSLRPPFLFIGLSGPSCSGKTTLTRYLKEIFPCTRVIHEDDYYLPTKALPYRDGFQNWDCAGAFNVPELISTLHEMRVTGSSIAPILPKEDGRSSPGDSLDFVGSIRRDVRGWAQQHNLGDLTSVLPEIPSAVGGTRLAVQVTLVEGIMLFGKSVRELHDMFDVRILVRGRYKELKQRRAGRRYETDEGWWTDPDGYFDRVVWPEYAEEHQHLFKDRDVNGEANDKVMQELKIDVCPDESIEGMLRWIVERLKAVILNTHSGEEKVNDDFL